MQSLIYDNIEFFILDKYSQRYAVSKCGKVISLRDQFKRDRIKYLAQRFDKNKYLITNVNKKIGSPSSPVKVHRLVAECFIPNPSNKPSINHINGIKQDNRVENLEWSTIQENNAHAKKNGLVPKTYSGSDNHFSKISDADVLNIRKMYADGYRKDFIHIKYPNISSQHLGAIIFKRVRKRI